ncbi:hypothetical protein QYE76_022314 [Lolium multiflorum]|uniref:Uncharacterized protein n=1 Tax=Lolium multiflorum TaxID=4521 RepID=A0AAD8RAS0_LOLMU|nr:hypothetical protein QYE76_022314 [Lolium multiflorum]
MAPPLAGAPRMLERQLLQAAIDGDLRRFKGTVTALDAGKGRPREAVEAVKDDGAGALHLAARNGMTPVCAYLVEELRVDVNALDDSGITPLGHAVGAGMVDSVRYLLDHGANPDKTGKEGCTPLQLAVAEGNCEVLKVLLSKGADVDALSYCGAALHIAAIRGQYGAMKILLEHHADCNVVFSTCYTPLVAALTAGSLKCVKLLIKAGADVKGLGSANPLVVAATEGLTDCLKWLLDAGADPNVPDDFGHLPIELAASNNRREDVKILLPVTSRIPSVHDWSIDGIINYVKLTLEDKNMYKTKPSKMKLEGNKAYKRKDYSTAATLYSLALNYYPDDATLLSNRSACWLNMDEGDKALTDAQICRMVRPDWPKACFREGAAQMLLKEYGKACDAFLDGLKLDPANSEIESALREAFNSLKIGNPAKKAH